jgi:hypothetical protein
MLRSILIGLAILAVVVVVGLVLLLPTRSDSEAKNASVIPAAPVAKHVQLAPEVKLDKSITVREVKVSDGHTYVTFSNGMKAIVPSTALGAELLKEGNNLNVSYVETDGFPQIQIATPVFTPPGCTCEE